MLCLTSSVQGLQVRCMEQQCSTARVRSTESSAQQIAGVAYVRAADVQPLPERELLPHTILHRMLLQGSNNDLTTHI